MKRITKKILTFAAGLLLCSLCFGVQVRAEVPTIEPTMLNDIKDETTQVATYEITIPAKQDELLVPVMMPVQGAAYFEYDRDNVGEELGFDLYLNKDSTTRVHTYSLDDDLGVFGYLKAQPYYLRVFRCEPEGYYDSDSDSDSDSGWISTSKEITISVKSYCYEIENTTEDVELDNGQWITGCDYHNWETENNDGSVAIPAGSLFTFYKIVVPKRGYIQVDIKNQSSNQVWNDYILCDSKKEEFELTKGGFDDLSSDTSFVDIAVEKGTYYLKISSHSLDIYRLKYTFHSNPNKKNYTKKKATTLKSGKTAYNVFYSKDKKATWSRWYKIKVPKKKRLTIIYDRLYSSYAATVSTNMFTIYNSKGNHIETIYDKGDYYTKKKIAAGTYYIEISNPGWNFKTKKRTMGEVWSLKWK